MMKKSGIDVSKDGWDSEMLCYPHVFKCDDNIFMLYNGNQFGRYGFGLAVLDRLELFTNLNHDELFWY